MTDKNGNSKVIDLKTRKSRDVKGALTEGERKQLALENIRKMIDESAAFREKITKGEYVVYFAALGIVIVLILTVIGMNIL